MDQRDEHMYVNLYARYHTDVWMPGHVRSMAEEFLPPLGLVLPLSRHYKKLTRDRGLPAYVEMPMQGYRIIDVTMVRETGVVYRVMIRFRWTGKHVKRQMDLIMVLDGDYEIVSAWWNKPGDEHQTQDYSVYEIQPHCDVKRSGVRDERNDGRAELDTADRDKRREEYSSVVDSEGERGGEGDGGSESR